MRSFVILMLIIVLLSCTVFAETGNSSLRIFGYFQNTYQHQYTTYNSDKFNSSSFLLQQLNLFLQRDINQNWTSFVNFELLNNYSSYRQWGAYNIEEAWIKYRLNENFNLKLGLQIPIFNYFNEIKNRTPLIPYVIRPLVYETSFSEFISTEEFTPARTFVQAYGFYQLNSAKLDYAVYLGNSPNVNSDPRYGQTGVDTTETFLIGGRLGIRYKELTLGFSGTYDKTNSYVGVEKYIGGKKNQFKDMKRGRIGGDFSYFWNKFSFWSEFILVIYDDDVEDKDLNRKFYYITAGYRISDQLLIYIGNMYSDENFSNEIIEFEGIEEDLIISEATVSMQVPHFGFSYTHNDRIVFKGQYGRVMVDSDINDKCHNQDANYYGLAVSVFF